MDFKKSEIGLVGLAVMGMNLARNIASKNISICVYNRTTEKTDEFIRQYGNEFLTGAKNLKDFIKKLARPRKIILLVKAGEAVDQVIEELTPLLDKEDIIIDLGNSLYKDTQRRFNALAQKHINFIGSGISGGEEGALHGPSLMPSGSKKAYEKIKPIFQKIAAKDFSGKPCVTYVGDNGAGHYVKMVHNGIEYGVMQIIAEAYEIFRNIYELKAPQISEIFSKLSKGKLKSYLFEITAAVLKTRDPYTKGYLIDSILDKAGQKGTGTWTAIDSLNRATAIPSISQAVDARIISGEKNLRIKLSEIYQKPKTKKIPLKKFVKILEEALYAGMLIIYGQGYHLIQKAAEQENWKIDLSEISRIWEGGCIIRAQILNFLHKSLAKKSLKHLFELKEVSVGLKKGLPNLRKLTSFVLENGVATPALASTQSYFELITSKKTSANLIQGLRDYFGAHSFERTDKKGTFHHQWQ